MNIVALIRKREQEMMHIKWLPIGLVAVTTLVPMNSVTAEEEEGEQRAAAISNLSFRQVKISSNVLLWSSNVPYDF